jgi:hypothetical protein
LKLSLIRKIVTIAQAALADLRQGQADVLAGDRTHGGQPSECLQQFAAQTCVTESVTARGESSLHESQSNQPANQLLESIWGGQAISSDATVDPILIEPITAIEATTPVEDLDWMHHRSHPGQSTSVPTSPLPKESIASLSYVRINLQHLNQLNYSVGELLTNQNRQSLQTEQIQTTVQTLFAQLKQQQRLLNQLENIYITEQTKYPDFQKPRKHIMSRKTQSESHSVLVQSLLDNIVQLTETAEAIESLWVHSPPLGAKHRPGLAPGFIPLIHASV